MQLRLNTALATTSAISNEFIAISAMSSGTYRSEKLGGVEYLVVPVVALVEGVLQGITADQPELALASEFARFPMAWNGRPITIDHPYVMEGDEVIRVSASASPDVLESFQVGFIFNAKLDGSKLRMEAWIDPVKAHAHSDASKLLMSKIRRGETIEVSTGLFTGSEKASGTYADREYFGVWRGVVPDHLALLPDGLIGACSNADGCGVYANSGSIRVHRLQTSCSCGGSSMSQPTQASSAPAPTPPGASITTPTGNAAFSFKPEEFLANMLPDGMLDNDVRTLLQNEIADAWPGAYCYMVGFTAQKVIFSMYDSIDGSRDTYQISYSIDATSKEVDFTDDLECVVLTTEITVMVDDDDDDALSRPKSPMDLAAATPESKAKAKRMKGKAKAKAKPSTGAATSGSGTASDVSGYAAHPTTENPMSTAPNANAAPVTPAAATVPAPAEATTPPAIVPNAAATTPAKPLTTEEFLASAPPEIRASIEAGLRMHASHKKSLVEKIKANARNKFTEEQLNAMDATMLENLAELAIVHDYSGMAPAGGGGMHANATQQQITANEADQPYAATPPRLGIVSNSDTPRGVTKAATA